jgi:hypothetical protein
MHLDPRQIPETLMQPAADAGQPPAAGIEPRLPDDLRAALDSLSTCVAGSATDFSTYRRDAWLYGIILGWDCEDAWDDPAHEHDDICGGDAPMRAVAARHGWDDAAVARLRRYRLAYATAEGKAPDGD